MSHDKKELIRMMMRDANVPRVIWSTTLPNLGREDLRSVINERSLELEDANGFRGIYMTSTSYSGRHVFLAFAKECVLAGYTVKVTNIPRLIEWIEQESYREVLAKLTRNDLVFIQDFIEDVESPLDARAAGFLRGLIKELLDAMVGVCVAVSGSQYLWCGQSLLQELLDKNINVE